MSQVKVYVTGFCPYCVQAKRYLDARGVSYETIDVSSDMAMRQQLVERTGMRTVPQIFVGERSLGGYTDMMALQGSGELDRIFAEAGVEFD